MTSPNWLLVSLWFLPKSLWFLKRHKETPKYPGDRNPAILVAKKFSEARCQKPVSIKLTPALMAFYTLEISYHDLKMETFHLKR